MPDRELPPTVHIAFGRSKEPTEFYDSSADTVPYEPISAPLTLRARIARWWRSYRGYFDSWKV